MVMQKEERKSDLSNGSVFSRIITKKRNKRLSSIQEKTEEIRQLMEEVAKCYNMKAILDVPTERDLIYYLYLNPISLTVIHISSYVLLIPYSIVIPCPKNILFSGEICALFSSHLVEVCYS